MAGEMAHKTPVSQTPPQPHGGNGRGENRSKEDDRECWARRPQGVREGLAQEVTFQRRPGRGEGAGPACVPGGRNSGCRGLEAGRARSGESQGHRAVVGKAGRGVREARCGSYVGGCKDSGCFSGKPWKALHRGEM